MQKKRIGIVGGGQLGRMLALAGQKLGFEIVVLDPTPNSPAGQVADKQIIGSFNEADPIRKLASEVDLLTFEIESAHAETLEELEKSGFEIYPQPRVLKIIKDKFSQKEFLRTHGIPVADFALVESEHDIEEQGDIFGYPFLLKARFGAYDGRGNALIRSKEDIAQGFAKLSKSPLYVEKFAPFIKEIAVVGARDTIGNIELFPVVETIHENNICHTVIAPAPVDDNIRIKAENLGRKVIELLDGVGVFAVEMFLLENGEILINEIAPRVHNSGHFTIEGSETSQFEQHMRAIGGLPLGGSAMKHPHAVMVNILGERSGEAELTGMDDAHSLGDTVVHIYGKTETRPERKMGHLTVTGSDKDEVMKKALEARKRVSI